jgi:hypothetical protein
MSAISQIPSDDPARGRAYLWAGVAVCLLTLPLVAVQFAALKWLFAPWYSPVMVSTGAVLILVSFARRPGVLRGFIFIVVAAFAGFQWFFLASLAKLPEYTGPVKAGERLPAFAAVSADRRPFTDESLRDGSRRAMVFFRGRW